MMNASRSRAAMQRVEIGSFRAILTQIQEKIAKLQSLPSVIARSAATWQSRCSNGGGFSDGIAALRSQ